MPNSLEGFTAALQMGCDGVWADIQPTRDGLVVWDLPTSPQGHELIRLSTQQAQAEGLVSVSELCDWFIPRVRVQLHLNIHNPRNSGDQREIRLLRYLDAYNLRRRVTIASEHPFSLWRIYRAKPSYRLALNYYGYPYFAQIAHLLPLYALYPHVHTIGDAVVRRAKNLDIKILPWGIDNPREAQKWRHWGAHGVFVNEM